MYVKLGKDVQTLTLESFEIGHMGCHIWFDQLLAKLEKISWSTVGVVGHSKSALAYGVSSNSQEVDRSYLIVPIRHSVQRQELASRHFGECHLMAKFHTTMWHHLVE